MKSPLSAIIVFVLIFFLFAEAQKTTPSKEIDNMRIEQEFKISVPSIYSDFVWNYLQKKYNDETLFLRQKDQLFHSEFSKDHVIDQYFDNEEMQLLNNRNGIRYRIRYVLSDSTDSKNAKELMQVKIDSIDENQLNRGEFKYEIVHYDKKNDALDDHPLLGLIKRKERSDITQLLQEYNINALNLFPTIKMDQTRRRVNISYDGEPYATISLDDVTATYYDRKHHFTELEVELNEIVYTKADPTQRDQMEKNIKVIADDVLSILTDREPDQTPKYNKAFQVLGLNGFSSTKKDCATEDTPNVLFEIDTVCQGDSTHLVNLSTRVDTNAVYMIDLYNDGLIEVKAYARDIPNPASMALPFGGEREIKVSVVNNNGCTGSFVGKIRIYEKPRLNFFADTVCFGEQTTLSDRSLGVGPPEYYYYYIDLFNDGTIDFVRYTDNWPGDTSFVLPSAGITQFKVFAKNDAGCTSDTLVGNMVVKELKNCK